MTKAFYLSAYEVTQGEYEQVMGKNPSFFGNTGDGKDTVQEADTRRLPVERVSWQDAVEFCNRLGQQERRAYRLPTEAEWEYACRAGTATLFYTGDGEQAILATGWHHANSGKRTHTVGQKPPNAFGLYDMHGNVREWCADWHDAVYYERSPVDDPKGPGSGSRRVVRGGSWRNTHFAGASPQRDSFAPSDRSAELGFRPVLIPSGQ